MVIDDDAAVRDSLTMLLETYDFQTRAYASGIELLADSRHHPPAYLIIDRHMPAMEGLDLIEALHDEGIPVRAILVTGSN